MSDSESKIRLNMMPLLSSVQFVRFPTGWVSRPTARVQLEGIKYYAWEVLVNISSTLAGFIGNCLNLILIYKL